MEKNSFISNFKKLPFVFLSSVLLFFIIQSFVIKTEAFWKFCYFYSNPLVDDAIRLEAQLRTIPEIVNQKKVFLTGSSQTREDFDVEYLNSEFKKTNTTFYNLGASGATQPIEMFMIKDRLLKEKPNIIIYMSYIGSFYSNYNFDKIKYYFNPAILPYILRYLRIKTVKIHKDNFIDSFLGEFSIFYKYRESIRRIFKAYIDDYIYVEKQTGPKKYAYSKNKPKSYFLEEVKKANRNKYNITPYTSLNEDLFILFAKDIISNGVKFIVINAPTHPLIKKCYKRKIDFRYNEFLSDQANKIGFVYLPEGQLPLFNGEEFMDFTHLNSQGRKKLSKFLNDYLLKHRYLLESTN